MEKKMAMLKRIYSVRKGRSFIALFMSCLMILSITACGGEKIDKETGVSVDDSASFTVELEPESQSVQTANEATAIALRQYVYARLLTEEFLEEDISSMTKEELTKITDELILAWESAELFSSNAAELTDQAVQMLETPIAKQTSYMKEFQARFMNLTVRPLNLHVQANDSESGNKMDPKAWAENLTKQFDSIKGAKRYQQLAKQLGTDAKAAYEQMALAQKIIHEDAVADADRNDTIVKILQATKTASKVTMLGWSIAATGGGSVALLEGAGLLVGGVDCIVDVAETGSTLILGENNQVAVAFGDIKEKLGPVSSVIGLVTLNPADIGKKAKDSVDAMVYISESLVDLFYEDKIVGVKVEDLGLSEHTHRISGQIFEEAKKAALEAAGFFYPETSKTLSQLLGIWKPDTELALARMDALVSQMAELEKAVARIEETTSEEATIEESATELESAQNSTEQLSELEEVAEETQESKVKEYAWVLVDTVHRDMQYDIDNANKEGVYEKSASASPGLYTYSQKYLGDTDNYYNPPYLHGESFATQLTFTVPPEVIRAGETISLSFDLAFTDTNLSAFHGTGSARADWGNVKFVNAAGKNSFEIFYSVSYSEKIVMSVSDTVSAVIPAGYSEGDQEKLWTGGYTGTDYIYEWKLIN